jgi:hypothetical protein
MSNTYDPSRLVTDLVSYEEGWLSEEETIELFQYLVSSGHAWKLQGHYGRMAERLIEAGRVSAPNHPTN